MANVGLTVALNQALPNGRYSVTPGVIADPNGVAPSYTTLAAAIATAVADGASPTQGHVSAVNAAWATFKTAFDAYTGTVGTVTANMTLLFDPTAVVNMNQAREGLRQFDKLLAGRLTA